MSLATTDQLKRELGISDTTQDAYLSDLLEWISAWVTTYCGRTFGQGEQAVTNEVYEYRGKVVWLHQMGIVSIDKVEVRNYRTEAWQTLGETYYDFRSAGGLYIPYHYYLVKVDYTYDTGTTVPKDIELAVIQLAAKLYRNTSTTKETIGDYSVDYRATDPAALGRDQIGILDAYRVRQF